MRLGSSCQRVFNGRFGARCRPPLGLTALTTYPIFANSLQARIVLSPPALVPCHCSAVLQSVPGLATSTFGIFICPAPGRSRADMLEGMWPAHSRIAWHTSSKGENRRLSIHGMTRLSTDKTYIRGWWNRRTTFSLYDWDVPVGWLLKLFSSFRAPCRLTSCHPAL